MNTEALIIELETKYNIPQGAALYMQAESFTRSMFAKPPKTSRLWHWLRDEIRELFCTDSPKYQKERESLKHSIAPVVGLLSSTLAARFGIEAGTATALAATALFIPLKLSVNAWCAATKPLSLEEDRLVRMNRNQIESPGFEAEREQAKKLMSRGAPEHKLLEQLVAPMTAEERNEVGGVVG